jgi:hypothetical protein
MKSETPAQRYRREAEECQLSAAKAKKTVDPFARHVVFARVTWPRCSSGLRHTGDDIGLVSSAIGRL